VEAYSNQAQIQRIPKSIYIAMILVSLVQVRSFPCTMISLALISFIEATQIIAPIHTKTQMICARKKIPGMTRILLVPARKSAEASMTSIANLRDFLPQQTQQKKPAAKIPKRIVPIIQYNSFLVASLSCGESAV